MTDVWSWLGENWFSAIQTLGIVSGLVFSGLAARSATRSTRVTNLFQLTQFHRDIWGRTIEHPELLRVVDPQADPNEISRSERTLVNFLVLNSSAAFKAIQLGAIVPIGELSGDIGLLMSLPIPATVWEELRVFHEPGFVEFVDAAISKHGPPSPGDDVKDAVDGIMTSENPDPPGTEQSHFAS